MTTINTPPANSGKVRLITLWILSGLLALAFVSFRITDVYRKSHGKWVIVQEHISVPPHAAGW